jgi:hypothetical protein
MSHTQVLKADLSEKVSALQLHEENPLKDAVNGLKRFTQDGVKVDDVTVAIMSENVREENDARYNRFRASAVHNALIELGQVSQEKRGADDTPAVQRVIRMADAYDKNPEGHADAAVEQIANTAYKANNSRRLRLEIGGRKESPQQKAFVDELYTAILEMHANPKDKTQYLQSVGEKELIATPEQFKLVANITQYVKNPQKELLQDIDKQMDLLVAGNPSPFAGIVSKPQHAGVVAPQRNHEHAANEESFAR